ncbi:kappa-type opioid receptor-like [Schistocerca americana]|uniref:kappa-type opioid receptor-like n=1 Tax=Schistocerca americana TaxID=7009 RepID=UPI001F4F4746|nr:kappa-type opioid receptor-like [Schistocerca americana]
MNLALSATLHNASEGAAVGSPFLPASFFNATSWSAGAGANGSVAAAPDVGDVPQVPAYIRTASTVACVIIMSIGVAGNAMVPAVILRSRDMRNSTNIFLVNLSVADLLVLLVCTPTVLVEVHSRPEVWLLGETMCKAVPFVELTVAHASVLTILAISFERYYAICEPLRAGYVCTKARALLICLLAWALAALLTSPMLVIAKVEYHEYADGSEFAACLSEAATAWPRLFFAASAALFFALPLLLLLVLYGRIARHLVAATAPAGSAAPAEPGPARARRQVALMLATVVLSFFLCLLPFRAFALWVIFASDEAVSGLGPEAYFNLLYFCRTMHYVNSAMNPILYNLMSSKFRAGFARLCGLGRRRRLALLRGGKTVPLVYSKPQRQSRAGLAKRSGALQSWTRTNSPVILVAEYGTEEYFDGSMVPVCFSMVDSFWPAFFFLATIAVFFLVPLIILVVLYGVIARHLMANPRIMSVHQQLHYRYRKQVVLMLGTVVAAFFVCLLPFRAFTVWIIAAPPETVVSIGYENHYGLLCLCRVMHYLNSAVNPILYNLMSSKFRDGFSRLCCRCGCAGGPLGRRGTGLSSSATATTVRSSAGDSLWRRPGRASSSSSRSRRAERRLLHHIARECSVSVHNGVCAVKAGRAKDVSYL